jgi:ribosomal protein L11 methyltransferase
MENYIRIDIATTGSEQTEMLIAELSEMDYYAFEENNDLLSAFISEKNFDELSLQSFLKKSELKFTKTIIPWANWNQEWENGFSPVVIERFAGIRAAFHQQLQNVKYEIIITPKISFGTGHHPTTFLMLLQMQQIDFINKRVLDFGTGTAVLAILAKKMGAVTVDAIDNDPVCIENARENVNNNNCDISLLLKDNLNDIGTFDIVLANITLNTILDNSADLKKVMKPGAYLVTSGFLETDEQQLNDRFSKLGFEKISVLTKAGWLSIKYKNGER